MAQTGYMSMTDKAGKVYYLEEFTLNTVFNPVPAVYVFVRVENTLWGSGVKRTVVYVGQTGDLRDRLPRHENWACFERHDANRICVLQCPLEADRLRIEADFIALYQPACNVLLKQGYQQNPLS